MNPFQVLFAISSAIGSFWNMKQVDGSCGAAGSSQHQQVMHWSSPPSPFSKINVDASWSKATQKGFAGVVVRSYDGRFVGAACYSLRAPSGAAVEALALLHGYEFGASLGISSVILESDSQETISCLSQSLDYRSWEAFATLTRVKLLGGAFQHCRWSWVPRSANEAAHVIVSIGFTEMSDFVWVDRPPSSLVFVLNNDGLPCLH